MVLRCGSADSDFWVSVVQVAIKKVLQDKRFKNRELQIMKMMKHPNVVSLKHCFYTTTEKDEVSFLAISYLQILQTQVGWT